MKPVLQEVVPLYAEEYLDGWVTDAIFPHQRAMVAHDTEKGMVFRDWRDLAPGDAAVNSIEAGAMTVIEMCEHFQLTTKDSDARMALFHDLRDEIKELRKYLTKLEESI